MEKIFVLYDGRARSGNTDRASVYVTADSIHEALEYGSDPAWQDGVWFEYDCKGRELINELPRYDLPPFNQK